MCRHLGASAYAYVVPAPIFLDYISNVFQGKYDEPKAVRETNYTVPEDRNEYLAVNIFWLPKQACWEVLRPKAQEVAIQKNLEVLTYGN
ncbi:MAG: hypothetical protein GXP38_05810 [Chloroflexi bacterium]|nr:hypothetical protein [Chloroflexota bacterium]